MEKNDLYNFFCKTLDGYKAEIYLGEIKKESIKVYIEDEILFLFAGERRFRSWLPKNFDPKSLLYEFKDGTIELRLKTH